MRTHLIGGLHGHGGVNAIFSGFVIGSRDNAAQPKLCLGSDDGVLGIRSFQINLFTKKQPF